MVLTLDFMRANILGREKKQKKKQLSSQSDQTFIENLPEQKYQNTPGGYPS